MKKPSFSLVLFAFVFLACSKEKVPSPISDEVEYRLESPTSTVVTEVGYVNETGGVTSLENVRLPFTVKVKRETKAGVTVSYLIAHIYDTKGKPQSLTGSIVVDGKVVGSKTGVGKDAIVHLSYTHR